MALQIWLPLNKNGDLSNKGLADITVTNNGATYNASGKIGGCYKVNGVQLSIPSASYMEMKSGKLFSFACWAKGATSSGWFIACSGWEIQFLTGHINVYPGGSSNNRDSKFNGTTAADLWRHIAFTWDGSNLILYVDGNALNTSTFDVSYNISSNINFCYQGERYLNDVRIYDHCLSPKEVKELSKGLVLHYPLNDWQILRSRCSNITWNLLFRSIQGYQTSSFTQNNGVYTSISTTSSDLTGFMLSATLIPLHKYLITFDIKKNYETGSCVCRAWCSGKSFGDYLVQNISPILIEWTPTYVLYNASNLTVTDNNGSYYFWFRKVDLQNCNGTETVWTRNINVFDLTLMFGSGNEPTYLEFNLMFPLQLKYERDEGTIKNLTLPIPDSSGYNNNGTITGTLTLSDDAPRYDKCTLFDGVNSVIKGSLSLANDYKYTASFWYKPTTISSGTLWVFAIASGNSSNHLFGCYINNTTIVTNVGGVVGASGGASVFNQSLVANTLYHIVITCDGTNTKVYVDGDLLGTAAKNGTTTGNIFWIGLRPGAPGNYNLNGKLSDFRIYATALSADDVKDLYQEAAFIDNKGDVGCYLFYEDGANSKELLPIPTSGVTFNSDGSYLVNGYTWPPTDYIPINPSGKTYYYDIEYSNLNSGNHLYVGFEKYDANKASGSNSECLYLVSTTSVSNHIRVTGTIGLATANGTTAAFTKLRILNNWDGVSGTNQAIIHHISLKEVSTLTLNQINKQGLIKSDLFIEAESATVSKYGNVTANQLIEI